MVNLEDPAHRVSTEIQVLRVTQVPPVFKEPRAKAYQVHQVQPVSTDNPVHAVTTVKLVK